jgi:hypothetical protein
MAVDKSMAKGESLGKALIRTHMGGKSIDLNKCI